MMKRRSLIERLVDRFRVKDQENRRTEEAYDEYGLPWHWRRNPPLHWFLRHSREHWPPFARWCDERQLRAFPAAPGTVLQFLDEQPVTGEALYETWKAIKYRHEAFYWNSGANPVELLQLKGFNVRSDGSVTRPGRPAHNGGSRPSDDEA